MRLLFFILLLVNVMAFAYYTYREQGISQNKPALPEMNAERIRFVNAAQVGGKLSNSSDKLTCWVWSGFKPENRDAARAALDELALGDKLTQPSKEEFWVYIPPLKNKQEAEKKLVELKALKITDASLVDEPGKWRFAISLAIDPTEDAATVHLNQLKEKGVKSAKVLKREAVGDAFVIQQVDEKIASDLNKLQTRFSETSLKQSECQAP
jgi:hypothetical protein